LKERRKTIEIENIEKGKMEKQETIEKEMVEEERN